MNIWKLTLNSSTGPSTSTHIFCTLPFFFPVSGILIYLSTLQPALVILPGCCHWFTGKLILIKLVGAGGFLFFFPGLWIRDLVNGNRGTEEEQPVPRCCIAHARPPGGYYGHAVERCGARCPGCWQGNITIHSTAQYSWKSSRGPLWWASKGTFMLLSRSRPSISIGSVRYLWRNYPLSYLQRDFVLLVCF